ncbi:MAG: hypothetical protein LBT53_09810 [Puniceicoccales bacterium]|jgi:hypothetical protein|nr:hypothetical protein [Puniceicoccales bacterium]
MPPIPLFPKKLFATAAATAAVFAAPALLVPALVPTSALACGPDFPNAYLREGSVSLLAAPEGFFAAEVARLVPPQAAIDHAHTSAANAASTAAAAAKRKGELTETGELRLALAKLNTPPARIEALAAELEAARKAISAEKWRTVKFSADMPAEFAHYLRGAAAYHAAKRIEIADAELASGAFTSAVAYRAAKFAEARQHWRAILALPVESRQHRSVTAAYMIGRSLLTDAVSERWQAILDEKQDDAKPDDLRDAIRWLRKTRELAEAGFADLQCLANVSYGWEARAWNLLGEDARAINLYLQQMSVGQNEVLSLRIVAGGALKRLERGDAPQSALDAATTAHFVALAQDELARRVITLYLLARFRDGENGAAGLANQSRNWAAILNKAGLRGVADTDKLAWIAYQAGFFELAKTWVALAPADSAPSNWIRAKLALRNGDALAAERLLANVTTAKDLAGAAVPVAWADLGRVRMSLGKYTAALNAFMSGGHWEDSAYIAERVLTLDELRAYIEGNPTSRKITPRTDGELVWPRANRNLRDLLARRYARANRPADAARYFSGKTAKLYAGYIADTRTGFDTTQPVEKRAEAFLRAARNARENGVEMLATELAPDFAIWEGAYSPSGDIPQMRERLRLEGGVVAPTEDERERIKRATVPESRFHYRYRAADLAWWAASLMPNDLEATAQVLHEAGSWLKARDPHAAERFYHALTIRCANTPIGKAVTAKKWFLEEKKKSEEAEPKPAPQETPDEADADGGEG